MMPSRCIIQTHTIFLHQSVRKVAGVLNVGNRVRRVRTEAAVTGLTGRVSALRDSSADCVRTVSKSLSLSNADTFPLYVVFRECLCVQCVPRDVLVRAVSSDVPVIMELAVILEPDAARVLLAGRGTTAGKVCFVIFLQL